MKSILALAVGLMLLASGAAATGNDNFLVVEPNLPII
jgi:hypothetical protein